MLFPFVFGNNLILKIVIENAVLSFFCDEEISKQLIPNGVSTAMLRFRHAFYLFFKRRLYRKRVYLHFVYLSILQRITKIKKHRKTIAIGAKPQCQCFCCVKGLLWGVIALLLSIENNEFRGG